MKRIMIIVWKWGGKTFKSKGKAIVNDTYLRKIPTVDWKKEFGIVHYLKEKKSLDEYEVQDKENGIKSSDIIVRLYVDKSSITQLVLKQVIDFYSQDDNTILLFLHRKNGYYPDDIKYIKSNASKHLSKIFLFGEGRDFIYFQTQNRGLLDGSGYFMENNEYQLKETNIEGVEEVNTISVQVADDEEKIVYKKYFDAVWKHYQYELKKKVFELKEDLLSYFYSFMLSNSKTSTLDYLQKASNLYCRIGSFLEIIPINSKEYKILENLEAEKRKAYSFDDCIDTLNTNHFSLYKEAQKSIHNHLMNKKIIEPNTLRNGLKEIRLNFQNLLNSIPD